MVYEYFNNPFTADFGISDLHLLPITIEDIPPPHKRSQYTPDMLPAAISVDSEKSVSTLTTYLDLPDILPTDDYNTLHVMNKYVPFQGRLHIRYCFRKDGKIRWNKKKVILLHMF